MADPGKDIVARARARMGDSDEAEHLIDELIEEVEKLRRSLHRANQIIVAALPGA